MYEEFDRENMFSAIWDFSENLLDALKLGNEITLSQSYINIQNVVVAGMGGSAIGGDVVSILEKDNLDIPFVVCRGYSLPNWVNEHTLVVCSSYSGNTEETLSALDDALNKKAQVCGITTGGELGKRLKKSGEDLIIIPSGLQPRAALAFSFVPMVKLLEKASVLESGMETWINHTIDALKEARELYCRESEENPVYELTQKVYNKIPIFYADNSTMSVAAVRLKGQFCENAKMLAYYNELPELNHNEIVGWENNSNLFEHVIVFWLMDAHDNPRVKHRQEITQLVLNETSVDQYILEMTGNSFQERFLHMIHYGDWLSFWCAIAHGTDPSPVEKISRLKEELLKRK